MFLRLWGAHPWCMEGAETGGWALDQRLPHICLWITLCFYVGVSCPCGTLGSARPCWRAHSCLLVSARRLCLVTTVHPHASCGQRGILYFWVLVLLNFYKGGDCYFKTLGVFWWFFFTNRTFFPPPPQTKSSAQPYSLRQKTSLCGGD